MMGPPIFKFWNLSLLGLMAKIKCSICSYQFNIWYAGHRPAHILIWFLAFGQGSEACLTLTTGCLGIALQPSAAHYSIKKFGHIGLPVILTCYVIWSYDAIGLQALLLGPTLVCHVLFSNYASSNYRRKHKWTCTFNFYVRVKVSLTMAFQYKWRISVSPRKRVPRWKVFIKTEKNRKKSPSPN